MARNNIFEILAQTNVNDEANRLNRLFVKEKTIQCGSTQFTLKDYVSIYCFDDWASRGHCLDMDDFLNATRYDIEKFMVSRSIDSFFTVVEIIFNCWKMAERTLGIGHIKAKALPNFNRLYNIMVECLSHYNQRAIYDEEKEQILIVADKAEVTAVAEIVSIPLARSIVRYNHRSLKGDIKTKKSILLELGTELEPKRKALLGMNKELEDKIFFMLNNIDLRHNNRSHGDKNYKEAVANMDDSELEDWYDELYQMMLLAFLELDQITRNTKVDGLKAKIAGGTT